MKDNMYTINLTNCFINTLKSQLQENNHKSIGRYDELTDLISPPYDFYNNNDNYKIVFKNTWNNNCPYQAFDSKIINWKILKKILNEHNIKYSFIKENEVINNQIFHTESIILFYDYNKKLNLSKKI